MFGGFEKIRKPKYVKPKERVRVPDIMMPNLTGGHAHITRDPNSNYQEQLYLYKQKMSGFGEELNEDQSTQLKKDLTEIKYITHAANKRFYRQVEDRVKLKLKDYEDAVNKRREKLEELLSNDEREFYWETIDKAQRGADTKMEEMQKRAQMLRAQRENERVEIVKQKRIQQYMHRCADLRVGMEKKHLVESKQTHLQQMRENEARREAEREIDKMWHGVMLKEIQAKRERDAEDAIYQEFRKRELTETWDKQIRGKQLSQAEADRVAVEDYMCMQKITEQLKQEEREIEEKKIKKQLERTQLLQSQILRQRQLLEERKKEEDALDLAYAKLAEQEIQREKNAIKNETVMAKREAYIYKVHLKELKEQKAIEEKRLDGLLNEYQEEINEKQKEKKCQVELARKKLLQDVLKTRAEQLEIKKQMAEQQKKLDDTENLMMRTAIQTNECLMKERIRLKRTSEVQYAEDLKKQIEYNNLIKQREREELERQYCLAQKEEENYIKLVKDFQEGSVYKDKKHPFRSVLETTICYCPPGQQPKTNNN